MKSTCCVSVLALIAAAGLSDVALAQTANITAQNANVLNLLGPFLSLVGSQVGQSTLSLNLSQSIAVNNAATLPLQQLAISDKNLLGSASNAVTLATGTVAYGPAANLAGGLPAQTIASNPGAPGTVTPIQPVGGLGPLLGPIFQRGVSPTGTTLRNTVNLLVNTYNFTSSDLGVAKNYFANGAATNPSTTPANYVPVPAVAPAGYTLPTYNGLPNTTNSVLDIAAGVKNTDAGQDVYGSSRPVQVRPTQINQFDPTSINGLATNPSFPSGHTTYAFTDSLLIAMMVPELYQSMTLRASEYGNSRIVLGVHYALDIIGSRSLVQYDLAQALTNPQYIGNAAFTGTAINLPALLNAASPELRGYIAAQCGGTVAACAASAANTTGNPYLPTAANQAVYQQRLTYGLPVLTYAQAPAEAAPAGGPDASILLAPVYGGSTTAAKAIAPNGGLNATLQTGTINQIIQNTEGQALAAFYGTSLSYWSRIDLYSAAGYFSNVIGTLTLDPADRVVTPVTVGATGVLGGTGTIAAATTVGAGGTLAPGGAAVGGTLAITGPLAFAPGSTYSVRVTPAGAADRTAVTGTTTINGATFTLQPTAGSYSPTTRYTILTSTGGVTGQFATASNLAFLTPNLTYAGNNILLDVNANYANGAASKNQVAIGGTLNAAAGANSPILTALNNVAAGASTGVLDSLGGEGIAASQNAAFRTSRTFTSTMAEQAEFWRSGETVDPNGITAAGRPSNALGYAPVRKGPIVVKDPMLPPPRTWRAWAVGFGGQERLSGTAGLGTASQRSNFIGGAAGLDYQIAPFFLAGLAAGGSDAGWSTNARSTSGRTTGFHVGAYASANVNDAFYAHGSVSVSGFSNNERRFAGGFGGLPSEIDQGSYGSFEYRFRGEIGYALRDFAPVRVTPFAAVEFAQLRTNGFIENGVTTAGGPALLNLASRGVTTNSTPTFLGVRFEGRSLVAPDLLMKPVFSAAWVHELSPARMVNTGFFALPTTFQIDGARPASDSAQVKAGLELASLGGLTAFANFEGEFSNISRIYAGKGGFRYAW